MSECNHDCESCSQKCGKESFMATAKPSTKIGKMIAVVSGKGGVGKSMVCDLLAVNTLRQGYKVGILDADITGPSIPKAFGLTEKAYGTEDGSIYPVVSSQGIKIMSMNLLLDEDGEPVVWRGPVISGAVKQFYTDVLWEDVDYMYVDMPPGTGDVPLTVFQSLPIDGIVIVATPQDLVSMIVEKAVKMANMMDIKILGIVENMSYIACPNCGEKIYPYGKGKIEKIAEEYSIPVLSRLPIDERLTSSVDNGEIENIDDVFLKDAMPIILQK